MHLRGADFHEAGGPVRCSPGCSGVCIYHHSVIKHMLSYQPCCRRRFFLGREVWGLALQHASQEAYCAGCTWVVLTKMDAQYTATLVAAACASTITPSYSTC
jgi:hypothetical protein